MPNRLEVLEQLVAQDPRNSLARYGLAMEFARQGQLEKAAQAYEDLLDHDPEYAAAYFHGGQVYEKLGRLEKAKSFYQRGIEVTGRQGNSHARSELEAALDMLG